MSSRAPAVLIVALAVVFVGGVLLRTGVFDRRPVEETPRTTVVDTLTAPPGDIVWIGAPPPPRAPMTAIVVWSLADPGSLAALDRAERWRLLYGRLGLRVFGICAPHAAFDSDSAVVATEVARRGLGFPVAIDPTLAWTHALSSAGPRPRIVLADSLGRVCSTGSDPGAAETELDQLVVAAHPELSGGVPDTTRATAGADADPGPLHHAPVWIGAADHPAGPLADVTPGGVRPFHVELTTEIGRTPWIATPVGFWSLGADGLTAARGGASELVALRYDDGPLAVMASAPRGATTRLWVLRDDVWLPRDRAGADIRFDARGASYVEVGWPRLYDVARADHGPHVIKLSPEEPGFTLHAFVFEPVLSPPAARP